MAADEAREHAQEAGLRYTNDSKPGITRTGKLPEYIYLDPTGQKIIAKATLERIASLVIPPAYTDVWISTSPNGHLQATGRDDKGRKQYRYHPEWSKYRNHKKYRGLPSFSRALPTLRRQIAQDLEIKEINKAKVTAIALSVLEKTLMRVGNDYYAKTNKHYGLTTLRDKHVEVKGGKLQLSYIGKKGVEQELKVEDKKLARLVKKCRDIPGYTLFQYYNEDGSKQKLDSGDINDYIREVTGTNFTAKDYRTFAGSLRAFTLLRERLHDDDGLRKKEVVQVVKEVAADLGNTPATSRKYYILPDLIDLYQEGKLQGLVEACENRGKPYCSAEECMFIEAVEQIFGEDEQEE